MKKLVFMLAGVACAASLQAATFNWASDDSVKAGRLYGLAADGVTDNATGAAASSTLSDRLDKGDYTLQAMITILTASGDEVSKSGWVSLESGEKGGAVANGMTVAAAAASTDYTYRIDIKGTQG